MLDNFCERLSRDDHRFDDTLAFIENHYVFTPTAFSNGGLHNTADANQGSCRVLALAVLEGLSRQQALQAFGEHYRGVMADPEGHGHANIRALLQHGLGAVSFDVFPLQRRQALEA